MNSELRFCVVVPMYNEEQGAEKCIRTLVAALTSYPYSSNLIVVNDGSSDGTGSILSQLAPLYSNLTIVTHSENAGYGGAIRTGIRVAAEMEFHYAVFMDSDLTNDPKYLSGFIEKMLQGVDVIKASRYVKGGNAVGVPIRRVIISTIGNRLSRWFFGLPINDCTNGFRAAKVEILREMPLSERGFAVIMEELYYAKYLAKTFVEIPYTLTARTEMVRKSSFYYRPRVFYQYIKYGVLSFLGIRPKQFRTQGKEVPLCTVR